MANVNAPYGFRLWTRLTPGTGSVAIAPGINPAVGALGPIPVISAAVLKVGDPLKVVAGVAALAGTTNAIYGICNSPVPGYGETATQRHYPEIIPADDQTIWRVQSIGTVNVTATMLGVAANKYRIGGATSGYTGINLGATTGGVLEVLAFAPGSGPGTYAELLVMITRGAFYGQA
jgi:hypothetical protein